MIAPRICIVAEHASKQLGGEAILPYHYLRILRSRNIDAFLIVHERTRLELESLFPEELDRIHFVPDKLLQKLFYQVGRMFPRRVAEATFGLANQLLTQFSQRAVVRSLANGNSVVHQPIPVSPRFPSLLWNVGSPVVIGPLNGGMDYPPAFRHAESLLSRTAIALGRTFTDTMNTLFPGKRDAAVVLVANQRTAEALPSGLRGKIIEICENAVDLTQWQAPEAANGVPGNFTFIGRLVDWKALDLVLHAMSLCPGSVLDVIGDGPMLFDWRKLAADLRLEDRVHFHGYLPQQDCARYLQRSRALVLPSIYECGGAVVLEAMAMSRPVIATAWGGPVDYLDETCGILVPPSGRESLIEGFAEAMQSVIRSPETAVQMGAAGRARLLAHFDWEKKMDAMLEIYASVLPAAKG